MSKLKSLSTEGLTKDQKKKKKSHPKTHTYTKQAVNAGFLCCGACKCYFLFSE